MSKIFITSDEAEDLQNQNSDVGGWVDFYEGEEHRWYREEYFVFKRDGRLYQIRHDRGLTEDQESEWANESDDGIECEEVKAYTVTNTIYKVVKDE